MPVDRARSVHGDLALQATPDGRRAVTYGVILGDPALGGRSPARLLIEGTFDVLGGAAHQGVLHQRGRVVGVGGRAGWENYRQPDGAVHRSRETPVVHGRAEAAEPDRQFDVGHHAGLRRRHRDQHREPLRHRPALQGLLGITGDPGTGTSDLAFAEGGVVAHHPGIAGVADLLPGVHGWDGPVEQVTVTRVG